MRRLDTAFGLLSPPYPAEDGGYYPLSGEESAHRGSVTRHPMRPEESGDVGGRVGGGPAVLYRVQRNCGCDWSGS